MEKKISCLQIIRVQEFSGDGCSVCSVCPSKIKKTLVFPELFPTQQLLRHRFGSLRGVVCSSLVHL